MTRILETVRDIEKAGRGAYLVASGTEAYFPVMGLIEAGDAQYVGEAYEQGSRMVEVRFGHANMLGLAGDERRTITIGSQFFATALKDYSEWPIKWWREVVQNSVDAGATIVRLDAQKLDDGSFLVSAEDNGHGMDMDTLVSKFLVLGATTKVGDAGKAGGFGKAKELLLLPWISWRIHTRDNLAEGSGIDYSVTANVEARLGTRLEVRMPPDNYTDEVSALAFIERCYLPGVTFYINGKKTKADLAPKDLIVSSPKADFYFTPVKKLKSKQYYAYVRVRGLYMFSRHIGEVPGYVLVEITAPSVDVLTANRDGFRDYWTGSELDKLAIRIAKDNRTALKEKKGLIRKKYRGAGKFRAKKNAGALLEQIGSAQSKLSTADVGRISNVVEAITQAQQPPPTEPVPERLARKDTEYDPTPQPAHERDSYTEVRSEHALVPASGGRGGGSVFVPAAAGWTASAGGAPSMAPSALVATLLDQAFRGPNHIEAAVKQLVWEPDFFVINEIDGFRVPSKFMPESMTPTILRLARVWTELCRYVLMQLGSTAEFGVGFIFSTDAGAAAILEDDNDEGNDPEPWLMLNPFKDVHERKEVFRPTKDADLKWLYSAAIHECTHVASGISYHDQSFVDALTKNFALCADGFRKIKPIVAGIRMRGNRTGSDALFDDSDSDD